MGAKERAVGRLLKRFWPVVALILATATPAVYLGRPALARFTDQHANPANTFTADTLTPPTGLTASVSGTSIVLNWVATPDTYADQYKVFRSTTSGGSYSQIATVSPVTLTTYTDATPTAGIRYYYVLQAAKGTNWVSVNSNEANASVPVNTGFLNCAANAAVTSSSGDNNGYEVTPGNACANDAARAEDNDSGTSGSLSCSSTARDRHLFYNYGFTVPAGQTINGIEVRLDAWDDAGTTPAICAELSWNGGASWTAAKVTPTLTTAEVTYILGSAIDTWGRTWTSATDFTNANFRVRLTDIASSTFRDFRLDWVAVRVTYSPP